MRNLEEMGRKVCSTVQGVMNRGKVSLVAFDPMQKGIDLEKGGKGSRDSIKKITLTRCCYEENFGLTTNEYRY